MQSPNKSNITRRHRILALAGVALIAIPMVLSPMLKASKAHAETMPMATALVQNASAVLLGSSIADVVKADKPAVVTVTTKTENVDNNDEQNQFSPNSDMPEFFKKFFGDNGPMQGRKMPGMGQKGQRSPQGASLGSGFIIDKDGIIVTNNHVVEGASEIKVTLDDGTELDATLVGRDPKTDIAVLKVKSDKPLPVIQWGESDDIELGEQVIAIGNPFGIGTTVTAGIVSARGRDLHNGPFDDFIQVDAAINHGNSGGPLIDMNGKVIGINSAIYSPTGGNVGVGFAIPSDLAEVVVAKLIAKGSIEYGFIGVQIQPVTDDIANAIGLTEASGALIASVGVDTPAEKAGVKAGDIATEFDGKKVDDPKSLSKLVASVEPGQKAKLTVWRNNKKVVLPIVIGQNSADEQIAMAAPETSGDAAKSVPIPSLGFALTDTTPETRLQYGLPESELGAIVQKVEENEGAAEKGIQEGDVIIGVNQTEVESSADAKSAILTAEKEGRTSVLLRIDRQGAQTYIAVPVKKA